MREFKEFKVVQVGGGTGLFTTIPVFKRLREDLRTQGIRLLVSAIVSVADDGGSTGRLRDEFGQLPPGDLRRALIALSHDTGAARKLFEYRFDKGRGLSGHSMGNLLLTALSDIYGEYEAIKQAGRLLRVHGRIIPVSTDDTRLVATLEDGRTVRGETNIDIPKHDASLGIKTVLLDPEPVLFAEARDAIEQADMVIIGPGDLYTSVIPNILVKGFSAAVKKAASRGAFIIYTTNAMTKNGETNQYTANTFFQKIEHYLGSGLVTHVVCNTQQPPADILEKYHEEGADFVVPDITEANVKVIEERLVSAKHFARHDPEKLLKVYKGLIEQKMRKV